VYKDDWVKTYGSGDIEVQNLTPDSREERDLLPLPRLLPLRRLEITREAIRSCLSVLLRQISTAEVLLNALYLVVG